MKRSIFRTVRFLGVRVLVLVLISVLTFTDFTSFLTHPFSSSLFPTAEASTGDIAIFRENTGTETVASTTNPAGSNVTWDTTVKSNSNMTLQGDNSTIDLADGGKYLVMYNVFGTEGTSTAGAGNRRGIKSWISLNGSALAYGRSGGYIRDGDGDLDAYPAGAAIIDASPGDDLQVHLQRDDTNPTSGVNIKPATNGVSLVKLKDSWDYIRLRKTATSSDVSGNTSFTDVTWDTSDETDTSSFGFTPTSGDITLKGSDGDLFMITVNVGLFRTNSSNSTRQNYEMILTLDGIEVPATRVTTYPRGNSNSNGLYSGVLVYSGIIAKTSGSDQTLNVEVRRESSGSNVTVISASKTALTAMKIPDTTEVVMIGDTTGQVNSSSRTSFTWDTDYRVDSTAFSHSGGSAQIDIDKAGDYLFFSTTYATTTVDNRSPYRVDWKLTGALITYGSHGAYNRANQSFSSGSSGGLILSGLTVSDYIELTHIDETTNTTDTATFVPNKVAIQGIALNENFFGTDVLVSATGTQLVETDFPVADVEMGGVFVIKELTSPTGRNITSITLTESGTIDAQNGLENVEIWYDLDETTLDCSSESFNGDEVQFDTAKPGFSGPNGVRSFSGSVSIDTSKTMCAYVVYDITASSSDSETIDISIANPSSDVVGIGASVGPQTAVSPASSTIIRNAELTQVHYHWINDDGLEGAASSVDGSEDTPALGFANGNIRRLRLGVSAEGSTSSPPTQYRLEYAEKTAACSAVGGWNDVGASTYGNVPVVAGFQPTTSGATTVTSLTLTAPSGITAGDLLLIVIGDENTGTTQQFIDDVPNWHLIDESGDASSQAHIAAYWRIATGTEGNVTVNAGAADNTFGFYARITGASTTNPINAFNFTQSGANANTHSVPQVTTNKENTLAVFGLSFDGADGNNFTVTGTGWAVQGNQVAGAGGFNGGGVWGTKNVAAAGGTVAAAVKATGAVSDGAAYFQLAINPEVTEGGGDWDVTNSIYITDGDDTTNIASAAFGAITDANPSFIVDNNAFKDSSSQTGAIVATSTQFVELEYAIEPTSLAPEGTTYCFRLTDAGTPLKNYNVFPEATVSADITVSATSTHVASIDTSSTNNYLGGAFVIKSGGGTRTIDSITISESGTVDAQIGLDNIELWYDLDTSGADGFDCSSESYAGGEIQFGSTDTDGFSGSDGSSQFTAGTGVDIDSSTSMCVYVILDTTATTTNGETIQVKINNPATDIGATGSVGPSTSVAPTGSTTIAGPVLTQTHYHWRNDNGDETDTGSGATSATGGLEDTVIVDVPKESIRRLRLQVSNEGTVDAASAQYRLEYGTKLSTCDLIGTWQQVGVGPAFATSSSAFISDGNTTDVDIAGYGAMTEENTTFVGTGALRETSTDSGSIALTTTEFTELEYAIEATQDSGYGTDYCFRVTNLGSTLNAYSTYPELTTREKQDFFVQRGTTTVSGTSLTLTAGVDYVAPSSTSSAFVRITNSQLMGAGDNLGTNGQNAVDVTAYIGDQSDITSSFTISRPSSATSNTRVDWEIVEYVGLAGADNEMIVRDVGEVPFASTELTNSGGTVSGVVDDSDILVFITGQRNDAANTTNYNDGLFTAAWNATTDVPDFEREEADVAAAVSYAVVEYTGANWIVERAEHTYSSVGAAEFETVTADVGSVAYMFVHAQKRVGGGNLSIANLGHHVWASGINTISFELRSNATNPTDHVSVAWVLKNTQTGTGAMYAYRSSGTIGTGAPEPSSNIISIGGTVRTSNASIFPTNFANGTGNTFPRVQASYNIASTTHYELWQSDTNNSVEYRVVIIEWPVAEVAVRQNYYRFYVDNDAIDPTDPWPAGIVDLGENTSITAVDDPLAEGEAVRIRMTQVVSNATLPQLTQSYKLQYGKRISTCAAIETDSSWNDVGAPGSGSIWRGYNGSPADGVTVGTTTISISDVFGTYEEQNNAAANPYSVDVGQDIEYDWTVQHNGALQRTAYCFRLLNSDDSKLAGYNNYPTLLTTGYTPVSATWQWFDDATSTTPTNPLANENVAPADIPNENEIKLRVGVHEIEGASGSNVRFTLQYSQYADFSDGGNWVAASTTCTANSTWCFADGGGLDATLIDSAVLSDSDSCTGGAGDGCGHHNEGTTTLSTLIQPASSKMEFEFTLKSAGPRVNSVYYFRLYDVSQDTPVVPNTGESYPSLVTEGASLTFTMSGIASSTVIEGVTTDIDTTPTSIPFGSLIASTTIEGVQRLAIDTNGTEGHQILMMLTSDLMSSNGAVMSNVTGTNVAPLSWSSGCAPTATSCFGYHAGDDTLQGGSVRFAPNDSYAGFSTTTLEEVSFVSQPVTGDTTDIVFRLMIRDLQSAGRYEASVVYISIPLF